MAESATCHTCEQVFGNTTDGEVWYAKSHLWSCLNCHLVERELQKVKGKGTVKRILQRCVGCQVNSSGDSTAAWFCYDCHQYLCPTCVTRHGEHVS